MFLCLIYYDPLNSGIVHKVFLLVACEIILQASKHCFLKLEETGLLFTIEIYLYFFIIVHVPYLGFHCFSIGGTIFPFTETLRYSGCTSLPVNSLQ